MEKKESGTKPHSSLLRQMPHHAELGTTGQRMCQDRRNAIARGKAGTRAGTTAGLLHDPHPRVGIPACGET